MFAFLKALGTAADRGLCDPAGFTKHRSSTASLARTRRSCSASREP